MRYGKIATIWQKLFCISLIAAFSSFGTGYILFKTIGLPSLAHQIKKSELKEELLHSSWCFRVPEVPLDTSEYTECGIRDNGRELLSTLDPEVKKHIGKKFEPMVVNKYFKYIGMEGPYGGGIDDLRFYWKGKNLYYGYYPGASLVRNTILGVLFIAPIAVIAAFLLLFSGAIAVSASFIISIGKSLISGKRVNKK